MTLNIKLSKPHLLLVGDYFYMFDERNNVLFKKVDNGSVAFTYPLSVTLGAQILAASYDGVYFWTLQAGTTSVDLLFKRWYIDDYFCKFKDSFTLYGGSVHKFESSAFFIEYYETSLSAPAFKGDSSIKVEGDISNISPGTILDFTGTYEEVVVTGVVGDGTIELDFFIDNSYEVGTKVCFSKSIWLFNHFSFATTDPLLPTAALYKIPIHSKIPSIVLADSDFKTVLACDFLNDGDEQYAIYVYNTSLRFINMRTLVTDKVLTMDNISTNNTTILPIYDIAINGDTVLRLQKIFNYYDVLYTYTSYNYQCSTIRSFVDSITLDVYPKVIPSDGVSTATLTAIVKDQYANPIESKPVLYVDDNPTGFMTIYESYTNRYGISKSYYKAGLSPATVTVVALATQYD